jgi:type VI secretion system protein ImpH
MPTSIEKREKTPALIEQLLDEPHTFSFIQVVSLLEQYASSQKTELTRVGEHGRIENEAIRFSHTESLAFPISSIEKIERKTDLQTNLRFSEFFEVTTTFFGLVGLGSPLPDFYTDDVLFDENAEPARKFLDIFHHNLISIFYRVLVKYRYDLQLATSDEESLSSKILALIGVEQDDSSKSLLRYAELFTQQARSAVALEKILADYFNLPIQIEEFIGRWVDFSEQEFSCLGRKNNRLGEDFAIGSQVFDYTGKFRICIRLLSTEQYRNFLPDGDYFQKLCEIVNLFLSNPLDFEVKLILPEKIEPPNFFLSRLGWDSWLGSPEPYREIIFQAWEREV